MTDQSQAKEIFLTLIDLTEAQRAERLVRACGTDATLQEKVQQLVRDHDRAAGFMESPTLATPQSNVAEDFYPGKLVDNYKIVRPLGEGGFGTVYMAEQVQPIRRAVALKVIKLGMDTRQFIARFEAERQTMAMMDHASIAKVLDAGATDSGRPFFVMELIKGMAITEYCDKQRLTIRERILLFVQVCQAVQHAHQKGIIHRDLKPSNVLVTVQGGEPLPKVIDFGIAKAMQQPLTDKTMFTAAGDFVGTPNYMSPEQADAGGLDIDTRSDIYSLGVLLYELLTGERPFDFARTPRLGLKETLRIIVEVDPPRPSTRFSGLGDRRGDIARQRAVDPQRLASSMRGDLDWIVMKALEKDRTRRYASASELMADIRRHLNDEVVLAGPPSANYRLGKFVRRHKGIMAASTIVFLALVTAIAVSATYALREGAQRIAAESAVEALREQHLVAQKLRDQAEHERDTALSVLSFLNVDLLSAVRPSVEAGRGRDVSMREVLDVASQRLDQRSQSGDTFADNPVAEASIRATLGSAYHDLSAYEEAERHLVRGFELRETHLGPDHPLTLEVLTRLGAVNQSLGRFDQAKRYYRESVIRNERANGPEHQGTLGALGNMGIFLRYQGRLTEAETVARRVLEGRRKLLGDDHKDTLTAANSLAVLLAEMEQTDEAGALYEEALAGYRRTLGPHDPGALNTLSNYGSFLSDVGRHEEAERILAETVAASRKVFGPQHDATATAMNNHAHALQVLGRFEEARDVLRDALAVAKSVVGADSPKVVIVTSNLAGVLRELGEFDEAYTLSAQAVEKSPSAFGPDHWITGRIRVRHAESLLRLSRFDEAIEQAETGYSIIEKTHGATSTRACDAAGVLAHIFESMHAEDPNTAYAESAKIWRAREAGVENDSAASN